MPQEVSGSIHIDFVNRTSIERGATIQRNTRKLNGLAIMLMLVTVPLWYNAFSSHESAIPAQASVLTDDSVLPDAEFADLPEERIVIDARIEEPVRLMIPAISVDAEIEKVAVTADRSMDVPKQPMNVGWYELGPRPGEAGSAVIAGHVDWKNGAAAVFADLHKVKPGDRIKVKDDQGTDISFIVREHRIYDATADATDIFYSMDEKAHLNMITCSGAWDTQAEQYSKRLVVFADRES
jgi:LPXTG-site transpeptidase (sortase) family protein